MQPCVFREIQTESTKYTMAGKVLVETFQDEHENTWLRFTLYPSDGNTWVEVVSGGKTDEGYSNEHTCVSENDDCWELEYTSWGRDCDGGYSHRWNGHSQPAYNAEGYTEWDKDGSSQRDLSPAISEVTDEPLDLQGWGY